MHDMVQQHDTGGITPDPCGVTDAGRGSMRGRWAHTQRAAGSVHQRFAHTASRSIHGAARQMTEVVVRDGCPGRL